MNITNEVFIGAPGLINDMAIKKPSYYAYYLLSRLGTEIVTMDEGYIVTKSEDYYSIDEDYGNIDDLKELIDEAHKRDIKVIMDLVLNHTSTEHPWFKEASKDKNSEYRDYYIWTEDMSKIDEISDMDTKRWAKNGDKNELYNAIFWEGMPDLNMDNPLVRQEVKDILKFWLDMGVDGFREDVVTFISKKEGLPDDHIMPASKGFGYFNHGPHLHEYLEEFKEDVFSKYNCMTLAEAPMVKPKVALKYIDESNNPVLDMMIQFKSQEADCLFVDFNHMPFSLL